MRVKISCRTTSLTAWTLWGCTVRPAAARLSPRSRRPAVWPDNWGDAAKSPAFQQAYIRSHLADVAANIKKPFILEEVRGRGRQQARDAHAATVRQGD